MKLTTPWPSHPDAEPYELTDADLLELRAYAAVERVATSQERDGDNALASAPNDWATVRRLRTLGLLPEVSAGGDGLLTDAGREVMARANGSPQ